MVEIFFWHKGSLQRESHPDFETAAKALYERHRDETNYALAILEPAGRLTIIDHQNPLYTQESYRNEKALSEKISYKTCRVKSFSAMLGEDWVIQNPFPPCTF